MRDLNYIKKTEKGGLLLELLVVLGIFIIMMPMLRNFSLKGIKDAKYLSVAEEMSRIKDAVEIYLEEEVSAWAVAGSRIIGNVDIDDLYEYGLPDDFPHQSIFGQTYMVKVLKEELSGAISLSGIVFAVGGDLADGEAQKIAEEIGYSGAYKADLQIGDMNNYWLGEITDNVPVFLSAYGSWVERLEDWNVSSALSNLVLVKTDVINMKQDFIVRENTKNPKERMMHASLNMSGNNITNVGIIRTKKANATETKVTNVSEVKGLVSSEGAEIHNMTVDELNIYGSLDFKDGVINLSANDLEINNLDTNDLTVTDAAHIGYLVADDLNANTITVDNSVRVKDDVSTNNLFARNLEINKLSGVTKIENSSGAYYLDLDSGKISYLYDIVVNDISTNELWGRRIGSFTVKPDSTLGEIINAIETRYEELYDELQGL